MFLCLLLVAPRAAYAAGRATPDPELRVCSQNGHQLGESKSVAALSQLAQRVINAKCDIIALQEVVGKTKKEAERSARALVRVLKEQGGRDFQVVVGEANDSPIRNAFLFSPDVVTLEVSESFASENLPMLQVVSKARRSLRGPDAVLLRFNKVGGVPWHLYLVTFHFKSKVQGWKDPTGTQFEATRLEMAEGLRQAVEQKLPTLPQNTVVLTLGDRNSEPGSASAEVLEGHRTIANFRVREGCRIEKDLTAHCSVGDGNPPVFVSAFKNSRSRGSYQYQGRVMFLDDILIRREDSWMIEGDSGAAMSGVLGTFGKGSDHKLLWVELNW